MSELDRFDRDLLALGQSLSWTPTPELASTVLESGIVPVPIPAAHSWRRWALAAALLLLLAGGVLAASSTARDAVADVLGIGGLRIERGRPEVTSPPAAVLGTPTSLQDLHRWLPFEPMTPSELGAPNAIYLRILENGTPIGMLAWNATDALPETAETGLGGLMLEFEAPEDFFMLLKTIGPNTSITETSVDGNQAFWIEGVSTLTILGEGGGESRWSGNVLIWEANGVGYRFESALDMEDAVVIAESQVPLSSS